MNRRFSTYALCIAFAAFGSVAVLISWPDRKSNKVQLHCSFCDIVKNRPQWQIIDEDEHVMAIKKLRPTQGTDCLIIPKKHIVNLKSIEQHDTQLLAHMCFMAQNLSKRLSGTGDFWLRINNGPQANQTVFHLHMHFKSSETLN